jgi:hypothetical protein
VPEFSAHAQILDLLAEDSWTNVYAVNSTCAHH